MSNTTTLVFDLDDTISFTTNRDWENAEPNVPLINKLNSFKDNGWTIHIVTARGQLSCGSPEKADAKYRTQIEAWLKKHGVKYDSLSFEKKLAVYYVDDKAMRPDEFVDTFNTSPLKEGMSGAKVEYDEFSQTVKKTDKNTPNVIAWYKHAKKHGLAVPKIYSVIGDTISMEYIPSDSSPDVMTCIGDAAARFSEIAPLPTDGKTVYDRITAYIDRCCNRHASNPDIGSELEITVRHHLLTALNTHVKEETFSHGDYSVSNILRTIDEGTVYNYLIDPIYSPELLSHWKLDIAKLVASLLISDCLDDYNKSLKFICQLYGEDMKYLVGSQLLRVMPYCGMDRAKYIRCLTGVYDVFQS